MRDSVENLMTQNDPNGVPISFGKDCWTQMQTRGALQGNQLRSTEWFRQAGNTRFLELRDHTSVETFPSFLMHNSVLNWQSLKVHESGTYLLLARTYNSPHHRMPKGGYYKKAFTDELCTIVVENDDNIGKPQVICRFGSFDHRDKEETKSSPKFVTSACCEIVNLFAGDNLGILHAYGRESIQSDLSDDTHLNQLHNMTLIKLSGNAAARYERVAASQEGTRAIWSAAPFFSPPSKFSPKQSKDSTALEIPVAGNYLVFGRIAVSSKTKECPGEWDWPSVGQGPKHQAILRVIHPNGRVLNSFQSCSLLQAMGDYFRQGNVSETGSCMDVIHLEPGCQLDFVTDGNVILEDHGTVNKREDSAYDKLPWQNLTMLRLAPHIQFDRYQALIPSGDDANLLVMWKRFGIQVGEARAPLFDVEEDGHQLVYCGEEPKQVLIMASFPHFATLNAMALVVDGEDIALSRVIEYNGQNHTFFEVAGLEKGSMLSAEGREQNFHAADVEGDAVFADYLAYGCLCAIALD
jgi:hypothetical protein